MKKFFLKKESSYFICTDKTYKTVCGDFLKTNGSRDIYGAVILMPGTRARKETVRGMKTASVGIPGMKSIGCSRPRYENIFNNSSRSAKTTGQFFRGYKKFQAKFEGCNFQDMYYYAIYTKVFLLITIYIIVVCILTFITIVSL